MKKPTTIISAVSILIIILFSCEKDKAPEPPSGNTNKITFANITSNIIGVYNATFTCSIDTLGNNSIQQHGFCWHTQENPDITKDKSELGAMNNAGEFSDDIKDLQPDTKYYIKAYVTFNSFTIYSKQSTFTTNPLGSPTVTTNQVINITSISAQCGGNVTSNGGYDVTARGVCFSTSQNPTITDNHTTDGTGTGSFTSELTELGTNTNYYVRAYATNSIATSYGSENNFITNYGLPDITTTEITDITATSAVSGGNITDNGGFSITARGVCWNTSGNPTLQNNLGYTTDGIGLGNYISNITGLEVNTTYYLVAYATNEEGTGYGNVKSFTTENFLCGETVLYCGQTYNTVLIDDQCWMKENLNIGTRINGGVEQTDNGIIEKYCYDDDVNNCNEYGGLYQWDEMMQYTITQGTQGICPNGWHIPTDDELKVLEGTVDSQYGVGDTVWDDIGWRGYDAGKKLKSTTGWYSNGNGTNDFEFTCFPGGYRDWQGSWFSGLNYYSFLWSSSEGSSSDAWHRNLYYTKDDVQRHKLYKIYGLSVRCLKD